MSISNVCMPSANDDASLQNNDMITIFYDGSCPLCSREIAHYQRLSGAESMKWIDIAKTENLQTAYGLHYDSAMARFHVLDVNGNWKTGAWGFAELWSHLPGYRRLAQALRVLRLLPLLDHAYSYFARWRLRPSRYDKTCCKK